MPSPKYIYPSWLFRASRVHTIVMGNFTSGMDSNLWMGVDYANDAEVLKVDRLQSNSELFFFQMRMKMDVNIVKPAEIVVHTAYTKTA